ncbi:hypothetical protein Egran_00994 [Elaphomyces granulatus]|uniref:Uncharacterized protein n=1 Tax=Elaphomyces granulatus TaxID=519963 RepID=A0A232M4A4_9EURO|nr:hypothetical protein Egran_00994 [Elaphomyces granulatus]
MRSGGELGVINLADGTHRLIVIVLRAEGISKDGNENHRTKQSRNVSCKHGIAMNTGQQTGYIDRKIDEAYFAPVVSTVSSPDSDFAVTSHAIRATARPRGGEAAAATQFWSFHNRVNAPGRTAEEMMTPISK